MSNPGLKNQSNVRTTARVAAVVLLLGGVVLAFKGISSFMDAFNDPMAANPNDIMLTALGGFCVVGGLWAANLGWMREGTRYVAGETVPVIKDSIDHIRGDGGFCPQCGTRAPSSAAKFCTNCGSSLS